MSLKNENRFKWRRVIFSIYKSFSSFYKQMYNDGTQKMEYYLAANLFLNETKHGFTRPEAIWNIVLWLISTDISALKLAIIDYSITRHYKKVLEGNRQSNLHLTIVMLFSNCKGDSLTKLFTMVVDAVSWTFLKITDFVPQVDSASNLI